jgi:glycosyltransferase involved in cell wall biosynthesis
MNQPLISIIVPLFNKEKYILATLRSVYSQSYKNWECLIIDDGSNDGSLFLVEDFIAKTPGNWTVLKQENKGASSARNLGIKLSRGRYIAFLDADDLWLENKLEIQAMYLEKNPDVSLLLSNYIIFDDKNFSALRGIKAKNIPRLTRRWLDMRGFGGLVESTGILRRGMVNDALLYSSSLVTGEGLDFVIRWNLETHIAILPDFLTLYRISENQLHSNVELIAENATALAEKYSKEFNFGEKTIVRQSAYFALARMRYLPKKEIINQMLRHLVTLNLEVFSMAAWIIGRNLRSKLIRPRVRKSAFRTLLHLN